MEIILHKPNVKASKPHRCNYCRGLIKPKTTYSHSVLKYEGSIYTWKAHKNCVALVNLLNMEQGYEGITQEDFSEYVRDAFHDIGEFEGEELPTLHEQTLIVLKKLGYENQEDISNS